MRERFSGILQEKLSDNRYLFSDTAVLEQTSYVQAFRECGLTVAASFTESCGIMVDPDDLVGAWEFSTASIDEKVTESTVDSSYRVSPLDVTTSGYLTPETVRKAMMAHELWINPMKGKLSRMPDGQGAEEWRESATAAARQHDHDVAEAARRAREQRGQPPVEGSGTNGVHREDGN